MELRNNNVGYDQFAVLTMVSWHSSYLQAELMNRQIPFVVVGGIKFSEHRNAKKIFVSLKLTLNSLAALAFNRILQMVKGIGQIIASEIIAVIHTHDGRFDFSAFRGKSYYPQPQKPEGLFGQLTGEAMTPLQILDILFHWYTPVLKRLEDNCEVRMIDLEVSRVIAGKYSCLEKFLSDFTL